MLGAAVAGRAAQRAAAGGGRRMWFVIPALLLAGAVVLYLRAWIAEERILRRQGGDHGVLREKLPPSGGRGIAVRAPAQST